MILIFLKKTEDSWGMISDWKLAIWDWEYAIFQTFSPLVPLQRWFEFPVFATRHPSDLIESFLMEAVGF